MRRVVTLIVISLVLSSCARVPIKRATQPSKYPTRTVKAKTSIKLPTSLKAVYTIVVAPWEGSDPIPSRPLWEERRSLWETSKRETDNLLSGKKLPWEGKNEVTIPRGWNCAWWIIPSGTTVNVGANLEMAKPFYVDKNFNLLGEYVGLMRFDSTTEETVYIKMKFYPPGFPNIADDIIRSYPFPAPVVTYKWF